MLRRLLIWTTLLFVILGGVLTGYRSVAQEGGSQVWMVVLRDTEQSSEFALLNPATGDSRPVTIPDLVRYLSEGNIKLDVFTDLYQWYLIFGDPGAHPPRSDQLVELIAEYYMKSDGIIFSRPSPDWHWIVSLVWGEAGYRRVHVVDLITEQSYELFPIQEMSSPGDYFGVAFSPDNEYVYLQAGIMSGYGIFKLRLDGNNPPDIKPILETEYIPIQALHGTTLLLIGEWNSRNLYLWEDGNPVLGQPLYQVDDIRVYFMDWFPEENTIVFRTSHFDNPSLSGISFYNIETGTSWSLMGWGSSGSTIDGEWMLLGRDQTLARIKTDGSFFETVIVAPEDWNRITYSSDGRWVALASNNAIYSVDMTTHELTKIADVPPQSYLFFNANSLSPDGAWLVYWIYPDGSSREEYLLNNETKSKNIQLSFAFLAWVTLDELP